MKFAKEHYRYKTNIEFPVQLDENENMLFIGALYFVVMLIIMLSLKGAVIPSFP